MNVEKTNSLKIINFFNKNINRNVKQIEIRILKLINSDDLSNFLIALNSGIIKMIEIAEIQ